MMDVQRLTSFDETTAQQLYDVAAKSYPQRSPWTCAQFASDLAVGGSTYYTVNVAHKIVAFLQYQVIFDEMEVFNVAVFPEYQGQGWAQQLVQQAIDDATKLSATIFLEVRASNTRAQHVYQKLGFTIIGERKNYYHYPVEDALIMRLNNERSVDNE